MARRYDPRVRRDDTISTRSWAPPPKHATQDMDADVSVDCGWGRLVFGQTFDDQAAIVDALRGEEAGKRDIAVYLRDPHVLVAAVPDQLFIDPSLTYRLWFHSYRSRREPIRGVIVRKMRTQADAEATNDIYAANGMVIADPATMWANQLTTTFTYLVAEDAETGQVIGTVTGVDHTIAFNDPESGASLWCLAVDPQAQRPGIGEALVRTLAERYMGRSRAYLDLSVLHDNAPAIALYEKLGFQRVPVFAVKRKNLINEPLFTANQPEAELNPYARIIADEARRRGITVRIVDAAWGELELSWGGRVVRMRESLSELTNAVAMSRCDDKRATRRVLADAGLNVARGQLATGGDEDRAFLDSVDGCVVKPVRGEQGQGITVGVTTHDDLEPAIAEARRFCNDVLLEEVVAGEDLRIVVIDHRVVAAAVRRPASVRGDGRSSIAALIATQSRRRRAATDGESSIPVDDHTRATVAAAGHDMDDVLEAGAELVVRRTANLHTGGTIHDVTDRLHPELARVAEEASRAIGIPVVGMDLLVPDVEGDDYVVIEANERPGLANHEPQPTAQAYVDLLFPQTRARPHRP